MVRVLETKDDVDFAVDLTVKEGWNYTHKEIGVMLELDPEGSFVYEEEGERLGFVTTVTYSRTGVIGHLIVTGKARGKRIGDSLVKAAVEYLEGKGVDSMLLYATDEGTKLYKKNGFTIRDHVLCVHLNHEAGAYQEKSSACTPISGDDLDHVVTIDSELFGDNRSRILKSIYRHAYKSAFKIERDGRIVGYIFARPDHVGHDLGPWASISGRPEDAEDLFRTVRSAIGGGILYTGTFTRNKDAERLFRTLPIAKSWKIPMMIRGKGRYESSADKVFALAAFELG